MTTTLLTLTLMLSAASTPIDSERAARLLVGIDETPRTTAASLLEEKRGLLDAMPDLAGAGGMMAASTAMGGLAVFAWWGFAALGGLTGGGYEFYLLTLPVMVMAIALTGGFAVLGGIGAWLMAKNIRDIEVAETRIGQIDEQLRRDWPTNKQPGGRARE